MRLKKKYFLKIKVLGLILGLFLVSMVSLLLIPQAINLAEEGSNLFQPKVEAVNVAENAPKPSKDPVLEVVDLGKNAPKFSASSILAQDFETGTILYQKDIDKAMSPASTTKLVTALVALDYYKGDDVLIVYEDDLVGGSSMNLNAGEQLTFRSLLYGMLLNSGNDAAYTIASNYPGGMPMFVLQMNKKAKELGLNNSHFDNPAGFDSPNHYSSASDLAKIAVAVASNLQLKRVIATKETSVESLESNKIHNLKNLNKLLGVEGFLGMKTGFTEKSGENLVGLVERNSHKVLTIVLNSKDRFGETESLIDWVYSNFEWQYQQ